MSASAGGDPHTLAESRSLTLRLDGFAWAALESEAAREGVSVEEMVKFGVLYYLADADSGRIARRISVSPYPDPS